MMQDTDSAALTAALIKAQGSIGAVVKLGWDDHGRRNYARSEDMIKYGREVLSAHGLALLHRGTAYRHLGETTNAKGKAEPYGVVAIKWALVHESGVCSPIEREMIACAHQGMPLDKAAAAAETYDLGYLIRDLLQIDRRLEDEIPVDERNDEPEPAYNPRAAAEERDRARVAAPAAPAPVVAVPAPAAAPQPSVPPEVARAQSEALALTFVESIGKAATGEIVKGIAQEAGEPGVLDDDHFELVREAAAKRLCDFCESPTQFAVRAREIQKNFEGDARARLIDYHMAAKVAWEGSRTSKAVPL